MLINMKSILKFFGLLILMITLGTMVYAKFTGMGEESSIVEMSGGCDQSNSPYIQRKSGDFLITYCDKGDRNQGVIESEPFVFGEEIAIDHAGYLGNDGLAVELVTGSGAVYQLELANAGDTWRSETISVPPGLRGESGSVKLTDTSAEVFGWAGIRVKTASTFSTAVLNLAESLFVLMLLFMLFSLALMAFKVNGSIFSVSFYFVGLGSTAFAAFFLYYFNVWVGVIFSFSFCFLIFVALYRQGWPSLFNNFDRLVFLAPSFIFSALILFVGWYPSYLMTEWTVGANRWLSLPIDNWLPKILGDQIVSGSLQSPMVGDWLSSDRGPLQTGFYLLFYPFFKSFDSYYQVISVFLQSLVLVPIGLFFRWLIGSKYFIFLSVLVFSLSSLAIINTSFVWPKLLATTYCLLLFMLFFSVKSIDQVISEKPIYLLLISCSASFSLLSHGSTIFSLLVISLFFLCFFLHGKYLKDPSREDVKLSCFVQFVFKLFLLFLVVMGPWLVYQKVIDPPGDRLLKWHFAGSIPVTDASFVDELSVAYAELSTEEWLLGRLENIRVAFEGAFTFPLDAFNFVFSSSEADVRVEIISHSFYRLFYSMWIFSPLFVLPLFCVSLIRKQDSNISKTVGKIALVLAISVASFSLWVIGMFIPGSTIVHQGSYFMYFGFMALSLAALHSVSARFFTMIALVQVSFSVFLYFFDFTKYSEDFLYIVSVVVLLVFFVYSLYSFSEKISVCAQNNYGKQKDFG